LLERLIYTFGMVPARLPLFEPWRFLTSPIAVISLFTHMFLHGGWVHFLSNMWTLFIFGDNVEDRMGSLRFLLFYLLGGLAAAFTQAFIDPSSRVPAIGASGAIAAVMGAYFLLFPNAKVITLVPLFFMPYFVEISAFFFLGVWFVTQFFSGVASLLSPAQMSMGGIAWFAHIGGFAFGFLTVKLFTPRRPLPYVRVYPDEYFPW
ncbi:MAG: rhomboid family intramembrane serine protease, partial [Anaerolineales bacterium]|nr:rhomboid family intramembrane serine protease [Anaerolineales bacterium]MDW8446616.1 rhomboid family intramembrane serine protease [Anaerolineales bacterium]